MLHNSLHNNECTLLCASPIIYRSESPSLAFMIILTWLLETLKQIPEIQWAMLLSVMTICVIWM